MASIPPSSPIVIGGVDTHKDLHVAAVIDTAGVVLGTESFSTTRAGYRALLRWLRTFGDVRRVGVEGTGSYGASVTRYLAEAGIEVLEVDRPDRTDRRRRGNSDTIDAENAAQAALTGRRTSTPKTKDGKGRGPAGAQVDPLDRGQKPPGGAAAAAHPDRVRARGAARPGSQPHPHAAAAHLRHLEA
jgi:Transposase